MFVDPHNYSDLAICFNTAVMQQCINLKGCLPESTANSCSKYPEK